MATISSSDCEVLSCAFPAHALCTAVQTSNGSTLPPCGLEHWMELFQWRLADGIGQNPASATDDDMQWQHSAVLD
ncbi:hypothetical protein JOB18_005901 [Solea senegalensis]|uniref:Uncharacterized protein n=1 Tax=Solea senegalensis TaxID=28829 RepID=A0AAV6PVI0_SOLSE|nr:hypothetical protein JOB18_005901 [Solea senegalensis]